jgi:hypothetical protein
MGVANIIQSYWSLPNHSSNDDDNSRNKGGWIDEKHHARKLFIQKHFSCVKMRKLLLLTALFAATFLYSQISKQDSLRKIADSLTSKELKEVIITGKKPLLESKSDRFIFNVANTSLVIGNNAWDVLRQTPLLITTPEGKIQIIGFQNASVYINDRKSVLTGKDLFEYLKTMPADNIVKIEIITSPSAKYEASDGGVINLVLKKSDTEGWKGSVSMTNEQKRKNSENLNFFLNYHKNRYTQSFTFHLGDNRTLTKTNISNFLYGTDSVQYIYSQKDLKDFHVGGTTSIDYELNAKNTIGSVLELHTNLPKSTQISNNYTIMNDNVMNNNYLSENLNDGQTKMFAGNLYYKYDNKNNKSLNINFDWTYWENYNNNTFYFYDPLISDIWKSAYLIKTDEIRRNYSIKIDYSLPLGKTGYSLEAGGKVNYLDLDSPYDFNNWEITAWISDTSNTNHFKYKENINSLYLLVNKQYFKKLEVKLGVRLENTNIKTFLKTDNSENTQNYNKVMPTANVNYKINGNHSLNFSYREMLWRPYPNELNPFVFYTNDNNAYSGNPDLKNAAWQTYKLSYNFKQMLTLFAAYQIISNSLNNSVFEKNGLLLTLPVNMLGKAYDYSFSLNFYKNFFHDKLNLNLTTGIYYTDNFDINKKNGLDVKNGVYNQSNLSLTYNNLFNSGINTTLWAGFFTPSYFGNVKINTVPFMNNISFSKYLKSADMDIKLSVNNPFNNYKFDISTLSQIGVFNSVQRQDSRGISFSVSKRFGNSKIQDVKKEEANKERAESGKSTRN